MKSFPNISDAEWIVLRVIWPSGSASAAEVVSALKQQSTWSPRTVKTLLARLTQKGVLKAVPEGRAYRYVAVLSEADCRGAASRSFVDRVFGGALTPLIAHFLEDSKLSKSEVETLRQLLDEHSARPAKRKGER